MSISSATLIAGLIAGVIAPPIISLFKNEHWPTQIKQFLAIAFSFIIACFAIIIQDKTFTINLLFTQSAVILAVAQVIYSTYFHGSSFETSLTSFKAHLNQIAEKSKS